jgi:hypothetical protein
VSVAIIVAVLVSTLYVGSLVHATRRPDRWAPLFADEGAWWRRLGLVAALTVAAVVRAGLAGADGGTLRAIAVGGGVAAYACVPAAEASWWNQRRR